MTEKENEEVWFTKNNKKYSSCFAKRLCHAREKKKARPSGKSGGLQLTKIHWRVWPEREKWMSLRIGVVSSFFVPECLHFIHPHAAFVLSSTYEVFKETSSTWNSTLLFIHDLNLNFQIYIYVYKFITAWNIVLISILETSNKTTKWILSNI